MDDGSAEIVSLLEDAVASDAGAPALIHDHTELSYRRLADAVERLAASLEVAPGERVAVVAPNVPALVVGMFAAWRVGAVAVPLSARLRRFELERAFTDSEPAAVVSTLAQPGFRLAEQVLALAERSETIRACVTVDDLGGVLGTARPPSPRRAALAPAEPGTALILYTSGTTGEPKGGLATHALALAMAEGMSSLLGDDAGAPYGLVVPASHAFGLGCLLAGIAARAAAVMVDATASIEPLMRALRAHRARVLHGSPALFSRLLRAGAELGVRTGFTAGSSCPPEVLRALAERDVIVLNLYGMTEIGAATACRREDPAETRYRTVGRALPGYELRIVEGEIQVRSALLGGGYHRRPWGPEELADGGWFRTGDLGSLDPEGNLTVAGRAKDVIHVGGFNVFPAEVESFLLTNSAIAQAAVLGVPHPALGEAAQAFVVPAAGAELEPREIVRFCRAGIAGYKVPYDVRIVDALPLLPSGKPDRRLLAQMEEVRS